MFLHYIFVSSKGGFVLKYEINAHLFSQKLHLIMTKMGMVDKKGKPNKIALYNLLYPNDLITDELLKEDRQKVTDKTRNIDNWLKGNNYPKRISDVLGLCNALNCDLDYFFTDMIAPTHDINFISNATGLSDISIDKLHKYTSLDCDIVDKFLSTGAMDKIIDAYIYRNSQYFQKIEIVDSICGKRNASDKENSDFHYFQSVEMIKDAINTISNDYELFMKLNKNHSEVSAEKMWKIAIDMEIRNIGIDATLTNLNKDKAVIPTYIFDYVYSLKKQGSDE